MMYTNDEMGKEHLLSAVFATFSIGKLELLLIKEELIKIWQEILSSLLKKKIMIPVI